MAKNRTVAHYEPTMTPTAHERAEWLRMGRDASRHGLTSIAKACRDGAKADKLWIETYDMIASGYRRWLVFGWN